MAATGGESPELLAIARHLNPLLGATLARIRLQLIHEEGQEKRKFAIDVLFLLLLLAPMPN